MSNLFPASLFTHASSVFADALLLVSNDTPPREHSLQNCGGRYRQVAQREWKVGNGSQHQRDSHFLAISPSLQKKKGRKAERRALPCVFHLQHQIISTTR